MFCSIDNGRVNTFVVNTWFPLDSEPAVLRMAEDRRAMYDGFNHKWFEVVKKFLKLAFAGDCREVK
jgi:hypothetical protein